MKQNKTLDATRTVMRVSVVSIVVNLALSVFKLLAGIVAHSGAMISDAAHSASDVFSTIIVMIGAKLSAKAADKEHPYGHERLECAAALILAAVLAATGVAIGFSGVRTIVMSGEEAIAVPTALALVAAAVSIVVKEAMFWATRFYAKRVNSTALMADAWHHRSDALSSVGALIGIGGSIWFGITILEPLASVVISLLIVKAAYDIFKDALDKMVDHSCAPELEQKIRESVLDCEGVQRVDLLHTREFGSRSYVEVEIAADGNLTLRQGHEIAETVHDRVERDFPNVKHITVHVNPAEK